MNVKYFFLIISMSLCLTITEYAQESKIASSLMKMEISQELGVSNIEDLIRQISGMLLSNHSDHSNDRPLSGIKQDTKFGTYVPVFIQGDDFIRVSIEYTGNWNISAIIYQVFSNNQWVNHSRSLNSFDPNGNLAYVTRQRWSNDNWLNYSRLNYNYDSQGKPLTMMDEHWSINAWVPWYRGTYYYDSFGKLSVYIYQIRTSIWTNESRDSYSYDSGGRILSKLKEVWQNNQWNFSEQQLYQHTVGGFASSLITKIWVNNAWVNTSKEEYTYDSFGNLEVLLNKAWKNSNWVDSLKRVYSYDENGNTIEGYGYLWFAGQWIAEILPHLVNYNFMQNSIMIYSAHRIQVVYQSIATNVEEDEYASKNELKAVAFPNPFSTSTEIRYKLATSSNVNITLFDANGGLVAELLNEVQDAGDHVARFDGHSYASGLYFCRIIVEGKSQVLKFLLVK